GVNLLVYMSKRNLKWTQARLPQLHASALRRFDNGKHLRALQPVKRGAQTNEAIAVERPDLFFHQPPIRRFHVVVAKPPLHPTSPNSSACRRAQTAPRDRSCPLRARTSDQSSPWPPE